MNYTIDLKQGLLGFDVTVPHMDKTNIQLSRMGPTQNGKIESLILGYVLKVVGRGMPRHKYPDERGDLYATIYVKMPEALNHDQIEAIEKLF